MSVLIVTSLGDIVVDLFTDHCPLTCKNFLKLCKIKYYNGCLFHTVQKDFTAQTGDPTGKGTGGDSIYKFLYGDQARFFSDEIHLDLKHSKTGTLAMASAGENLNASQFYFTLRDDLDYLDGKHTVFGEVAEGLETLTRINEAYVDEKGRPYKNIRIKHTYILDDPLDDPSQLTELIPDASPEGKPKNEVDDDVRLEDDWVPLDEQLDASELEELIRSKEAHSRAVLLESVGDIPDAEIKPPDNVLFVCKLNPVTEDDDLHTIFSRFGTVISAEIIRDYKTGDSLCYAFIEFETNEACEQAYFKMDNALIDDRRIHVDFSQSVAKLWSQYRRRGQETGKGKGCFKCGAVDHIAKDCTGSPTKQQKPPKYVLKDNDTQRGGDNSRYEMVFDEKTSESPKRENRRHDYGPEDRSEKEKMRDSDYTHPRQSDKGRGYRDNERNHESSRGSRRESSYHHEERIDREKHRERREEGKQERDERDYHRKRNAENDGHSRERRRDGRDERDYHRKRNADGDDRHVVDGRDDRGDGRDGGRDYRKRSAENGEHGSDRRGDRDHRKTKADEDRREKRDMRDEPGYRKKRSADGDDNGGRMREERGGHRRRHSTESDDERDKRRRGDRR